MTWVLLLSPFYGRWIVRAMQYIVLRSPGWWRSNQEDKKRSFFPTSKILLLTTHTEGTIFLAPVYSSFSSYRLTTIFPFWQLPKFSEFLGFPLQLPIYENHFLEVIWKWYQEHKYWLIIWSVQTPRIFVGFVCLVIYLSVVPLGLHFCTQTCSSCGEQGLLFVVMPALPIAVALGPQASVAAALKP